ncbi:hypothetical protein EBT31_16975 [bacterium]|nr:hypothetical protein [bacterium]NBX50329.1 hypothetical protein [bacterium]
MTVLNTQSSSKPRLGNDTLGDDALKSLYAAYEQMGFDEFRAYAENVVQSGGGKQPMKDKIIAEFYKPLASKTSVLTKAQNFILAGMGLGV